MRRAVLHNRRYTPAQLQELGDSRELISADMPSHRQSGYQGWAPGSSDNEGDVENLASARARLRSASAQLTASTARLNAEMNRAEMDRESAIRRRRRELEAEALELERARRGNTDNWNQSHFTENGSGGEPTFTESSLRTTALLQSVRRHSRFSTRSRNQLENYILERERTNQANENQLNSTSTRLNRGPTAVSPTSQQQQEQQRALRARIHALQQLHPDSTSANPEEVSWLEEAIKYLERLRFCDTYSERISSAAEGGFIQGEFFTHNHEDFILDTTTIDPPPASSWLKVGGIFSGSQHAAGGSIMPPYTVSSQFTRGSAGDRGPRNNPVIRGSTQTSRGAWVTTTASRISEGDERWPVKVTIHSIDYNSMTLSGTMEAFNVPDKTSPSQESSITTFLEGEIIDFNKFTLETKSFNANPKVDGTYWRKLEPFKKFTDEEMVRNLVSMKWLSEGLSKKWILMRWKGEACTFEFDREC